MPELDSPGRDDDGGDEEKTMEWGFTWPWGRMVHGIGSDHHSHARKIGDLPLP